MNRKSVFLIVVPAIMLSLSACGPSPSVTPAPPTEQGTAPSTASEISCTKPAEVVSISPDPAVLGQSLSIHVPGSTKGIVIRDTLINLEIKDSSGRLVKQYGYEHGGFPEELDIASSSGWKWSDTFKSGKSGRWTITVKYVTAGGETKSVEGAFCMNEGATSVPKITGDVVKPPTTPPPKRQEQSKIAFTSDRDGNPEIYVMNADGSGLKNLTNNPADDAGTSWSPDGKKLAFMPDRDGNYEIYVMNADGSGQKNLTNNPADDAGPSWSPDGEKIVFESRRYGNWEIYVMNADGSGLKNLTNNPALDRFPSWSPDGKKIVFTSLRDGNWEIYVMNADGSEQKNLTNNPAGDIFPAWSP